MFIINQPSSLCEMYFYFPRFLFIVPITYVSPALPDLSTQASVAISTHLTVVPFTHIRVRRQCLCPATASPIETGNSVFLLMYENIKFFFHPLICFWKSTWKSSFVSTHLMLLAYLYFGTCPAALLCFYFSYFATLSFFVLRH